MVSEHVVSIILKAEDRITQITQKVDEEFKKLKNDGQKGFDNVSQSSQKATNEVKKMPPSLQEVQAKIQQLGGSGASAFNQLTVEERALISQTAQFQSSISSATSTIQRVGSAGSSAFNQLSGAEKEALMQLTQMSSSASTTASTMSTAFSGIGNTIRTNLANAWDSVKTKASSTADTIKNKLSSAVDSAKTKIEGLGSAFGGLGGVISSALGTIGMSSITQLTVGLAMTRERMTTLTQATMGSRAEAEKFVDSMDKLTNNSLVSLNDLGQAMNTVKMSTGMTNDQLSKFATTVNDIGQRAILMGKDSNEAMTLMQAAGRGLNGDFMLLKHTFGITKETLTDLGWSGAADDVEGYQKALDKALERGGNMDEMMQTTEGQIALVKKGFTSAGRQIGEAFLPVIKKVIDIFAKIKETNPDVFKLIIIVGALVSGFAMVAPVLGQIITGFGILKDTITGIPKTLSNFKKSVKNAIDAVTGLKDKITKSWEDGQLKKIKDKFDNLKNKAGEVKDKILSLKTTISNSWNEGALSKVRIGLDNIKNKASMAKTKVLELATSLKSFVVDKIKGLAESFKTLASNISLANIKTKLQAAYQWLVNGATAVWNALLAMNPVMLVVIAIVALIAVLVYLYQNNETVRNSINWLWQKMQEVGAWIQSTFVAAWNSLVAALQPVISFLDGTLGNAIRGIIALLSGDTQGAMSYFTQAWNTLMSALQPISDFLSSVFGPAWDSILAVLQAIWNAVQSIIMAFVSFMQGQISLPTLLTTIWNSIVSIFSTIFSTIIMKVVEWAAQLLMNALNAGRNFLNGVISFVSQLPGKIWAFLTDVISKIVSAGAQWVSNAKSKASEMVNGVISYVSQLPGKVYTEFMNIGNRMLEAGSQLVEKAKNIGKNIVDGILGAMGIHSPGTIQTKIALEFKNMVGKIADNIEPAGKAANEVGKTIVDSFKSNDIEDALNLGSIAEKLEDFQDQYQMDHALDFSITKDIGPEAEVSSSVDNSGLATGLGETSTLIADGNTAITDNYSLLSETMQGIMNGIVMSNQSAFMQMQMNESQAMNSMATHVQQSMNLILANTQLAMSQANNITQQNLLNMQNSTAQTTQRMIQAWNTMKTSIINAASQIQSQATARFNQLSTTIGNFYRKLQNPSGWGAGPAAGGRGVRSSPRSRQSNFRRAVAERLKAPSTITIGEVQRNPCLNGNCIEYIKPAHGDNVSTSDLVIGGAINCTPPVGMGAGWESTVAPNVNHIRKVSNEWGMKGPVVAGKYPTGITFKVKEFENGTPHIDFASFKSMAEDVFSQCHYEFYYDSERYGNWIAAFQNGGMNCSDSTDALLWMARACGLSGSKVHGHWGSYGHFWAEIEGHKMDTTGWMNQRNWTPSQSHAGSPPRDPFAEQNGLLGEIASKVQPTGTGEGTESETVADTISLDGEVHIVHDFVNLPDNVDEQTIAQIVKDTTEDGNWIKKLVNNSIFQKANQKANIKLERQTRRARGV